MLSLIKVQNYPQVQVGLTFGSRNIMWAMGWPFEWPSKKQEDGITRIAAGFWSLSWWRTRSKASA